jgi:hypothetical protein
MKIFLGWGIFNIFRNNLISVEAAKGSSRVCKVIFWILFFEKHIILTL